MPAITGDAFLVEAESTQTIRVADGAITATIVESASLDENITVQ